MKLTAVAILLAVALAGCTSTGTDGQKSPAKKASSNISHGLGSKDASADVRVGKITVDPMLKLPSVKVTVTNHSSKRSNYIIELSLESADGKTQLDTAPIAVNNLEAGQSTVQTGQFTTTDKLPRGARVVLKSIDRLAAS